LNEPNNSKRSIGHCFTLYSSLAREVLLATQANYGEFIEGLTLPSDLLELDIEEWVYEMAQQQNEAVFSLADYHETLNPHHLFGLDGKGGDPEGLHQWVDQLAGTYSLLIDWGLELRRRDVGPDWQPVLWALSEMQIQNVKNLNKMLMHAAVNLPKEVKRFIEGRQDFIDIDLNLKFDLNTEIRDRFLTLFEGAAGHPFKKVA
jgi:hypothetical protein